MKHILFFITLAIFILGTYGCGDDTPLIDEFSCEENIEMVALNKVQVIGSHNSYRIRPNEAIMQLIYNSEGLLPSDFDPKSWDYGHVSLDEQFSNFQIRSVELDVYRDPTGGLFYARGGNALVGMDPESHEPALLEPGLKILHFPDFDYLTHHLTFKDALENIKTWSFNHPRHVPITILIEAKEDSPGQLLPGYGLTSTMAFDATGVNEIESEIQAVFGNNSSQIFVPDELRASYSTLNEAVLAGNWPELSDIRGKLIFVLMGTDEVINNYVQGHASLAGRNMFVFAEAGTPESAYLKVDDPVANLDFIQQRIAEGYQVRTRADADTFEARNGDVSRLQTAIQSGAQIISTDYYQMDERALAGMGWTNYEAHFDNDQLAILNGVNLGTEILVCAITE